MNKLWAVIAAALMLSGCFDEPKSYTFHETVHAIGCDEDYVVFTAEHKEGAKELLKVYSKYPCSTWNASTYWRVGISKWGETGNLDLTDDVEMRP